jgi:hypothetical protein
MSLVEGMTLPRARCFNEADPTDEVDGVFTYFPPEGTPMSVGTGQTVAVLFMPTNRAYDPAELTLTIDICPVRGKSFCAFITFHH